MKWVITVLVSFVIALVWAIVRASNEYSVQSRGCLRWETDCWERAEGISGLVGVAVFSSIFLVAFALGAAILLFHRLLFKRVPPQEGKQAGSENVTSSGAVVRSPSRRKLTRRSGTKARSRPPREAP